MRVAPILDDMDALYHQLIKNRGTEAIWNIAVWLWILRDLTCNGSVIPVPPSKLCVLPKCYATFLNC